MAEKTKFPVWLFVIIFIAASILPIINRLISSAKTSFAVRNNPGVSSLVTQDNALIAVFSDGRANAWDWSTLNQQLLWQCSVGSDRLVMLDNTHAAAITRTGRKILTQYDISSGQKISETSVGWEDQDVWLTQSPDKKVLALVRINPDKNGHTLYEFMTLDVQKNNPQLPVTTDVLTAGKRLIAFAVSNDNKMLAAGNSDKHGWLIAVDLIQGKIILEKEYLQAEEFTSAAFMPDGQRAFLTSRNGPVYGIDSSSGEIRSTWRSVKPGEKNTVTNDTSSQNIVISDNGQYVAAVMFERKVAVWDTQTGQLVFQKSPGHKLVGSIAFSKDGSLLATSDKRASGSVHVWQIKK